MSGGGGGEQTVGYRYYMTMHMGVCMGPVDALLAMSAGGRDLEIAVMTDNGVTVANKPDLFGGEEREGGIRASIYVRMGADDQVQDPILGIYQPGDQPAYRGIFGIVLQGLVSCNNPYIKPIAYKVRRILSGWFGDAPWYSAKAVIALPEGRNAANPAHIIYECLTNPEWGMGESPAMIDDASFRAAADVFHEEGMGLCMLWTRQAQIQDFIGQVVNHAGAAMGQDRRTGLYVLRALRGDYVVDDLPSFDPSNILRLESYQRPSIPESINEVTVVYTNNATGDDAATTVQNLANITAQGGIVSESKRYPGLPTGELAARVGMRDLLAVSTPLAKVRMQVNRSGYAILPGDVIRMSWPKLGITNLVLRVLQAGAGNVTDGAIMLDCAEDVFGLPSATYTQQEPSAWQDPASEPAPAAHRVVQEATYYQLQRTMSPGDLSVLPEEAGFISTTAVRPSGDSIRYRIRQRYGVVGNFADGGVGQFCPTAVLAGGINRTATALTFATAIDADLVDIPEGGLYAFLGEEIVRVDAFDEIALTATIGRGCMDTVAEPHLAGSRLYFAQGYEASDGIQRLDGDVVQVKLLPSTGRGVLPEVSAPTDSVLMDQRHFRPYPPGRLRINGEAYPAVVDEMLVVSWAHRDRLLQNLEGDETGSIGPEPGTTYTVRVFNDATDVMTAEMTGLTGTSATFLTLSGFYDARVEAFSVRDGLESRQKHEFVFDMQIEASANAAGVTLTATASIIPGIASVPVPGSAAGVVLSASAALIEGLASGGGGTDPDFASVVLLLHLDGSNGSTTFTDSSSFGRAPAQIASDAQISTADSMFGGACLSLDGGADAIRYADDADFGFGTGDFTIEFFAKINPSGNMTVMSMLQSGRSTTIHLYVSSNSLIFYTNGGNVLSSGSITSAWHHFALSRASGSTRLFVDGVQQGSTYADSNDYGSTQQFAIGDYGDPLSGGSTLAGYIDEVRITKGVGRYTTTFAPPASPFPDA